MKAILTTEYPQQGFIEDYKEQVLLTLTKRDLELIREARVNLNNIVLYNIYGQVIPLLDAIMEATKGIPGLETR
jgi:hypothetical protein